MLTKKELITVIGFLIVCTPVLISSTGHTETWYEDNPEDIIKIKEDISLLNLINALDLQKNQITKIIAQAYLAQQQYKEFLRKIKTVDKEYLNELESLKERLEQGISISDQMTERIHLVEKERHRLCMEFYQGIKQLQDKLTEVLEAEQIYMVEDFQPCVIPPKDLTNPVRAGQSGNNIAEIEKLINDLRDLPDDIFEFFSNKVIDQIITETELIFGKLNPENHKKEKDRLVGIITAAKDMDELTFLVEKQKLAKQFIKRSDNVVTKLNNLSKLETEMHGGISRIGKFLLNPQIIPLLKPRLSDSFNPIQASNNQNEEIESLKGEKIKFEKLSQILSLDNDQEEKIKKNIQKGQEKLWKILILPREDNIDIIKNLGSIDQKGKNTTQKESQKLKLLALKLPDSEKTYFEAMIEIAESMEKTIEEILTAEQFRTFKTTQINLFDVQMQP